MSASVICPRCGMEAKKAVCMNPNCKAFAKKIQIPQEPEHPLDRPANRESFASKWLAFLLLFCSIGWLIGFGVLMSAVDAPREGDAYRTIIAAWLSVFALIFVSGAGVWAAAKGHPAIVGVMLAFFLSGLGLLILACLPDFSIKQDNIDK